MQSPDLSNEFYRTADLKELLKIRSEENPIFSLYLDLRPEKNAAKDLPARFQHLVRQAELQKILHQSPVEYQNQWEQEVHHILRWLDSEHLLLEQNPKTHGLAVFSSLAHNLWRVFILPVPVFDRLSVTNQPHVRPLEIVFGEFPCSLFVLVDAGTARLVEVFLGKAAELERMQAEPGLTDRSQFARSVAERAETLWREQHCDRLVIGGSDEMLNALRDMLPEPMRVRLVGETRLSPQAEQADILAQVLVMENEQEQRLETQRVQELLTQADSDPKSDSGGLAVLGPEQTFLAVRGKKVQLLVVDQDFHQEGGECPNCGFLGEWEQGICLLCEVALRPEADIIEAALKRTLDQGGEIEILRNPATRLALQQHGQIGALLHNPTVPSTQKDKAGRITISRGGKTDPEVRYDETVDESFPASDPPSW